MYLLAETNLEDVLESVNELKPDVLIVDSIQTLYNGDLTTAPGSVGQVKDCTMALMQLAKGQGITVFVIGHVNKEGSIAGPKVLEHMVDLSLIHISQSRPPAPAHRSDCGSVDGRWRRSSPDAPAPQCLSLIHI